MNEKEPLEIEILKEQARINTLKHNIVLMKSQIKAHKETIEVFKERRRKMKNHRVICFSENKEEK